MKHAPRKEVFSVFVIAKNFKISTFNKMNVLCQRLLINKISFNFWNNNFHGNNIGKVVVNVSKRKNIKKFLSDIFIINIWSNKLLQVLFVNGYMYEDKLFYILPTYLKLHSWSSRTISLILFPFYFSALQLRLLVWIYPLLKTLIKHNLVLV